MSEAFGEFIKKLMVDRKMGLGRLSQNLKERGVKLSKTALYNLLSAPTLYNRHHRALDLHKITTLAGILAERPSDRSRIYELAGYGRAPDEEMTRLQIILDRCNTDDERREFLDQMEFWGHRWLDGNQARKKSVSKVIIPAAGWQASLLAPDRLEATLLPALNESAIAGMREAIVIVAPGFQGERIRNLFEKKHLNVTLVEQSHASGLGNALLLAKPHLEVEPWAVILPDEVDTTGKALAKLVREYDRLHKPIVAVNPKLNDSEKREGVRYYGIAVLPDGAQRPGLPNRVVRVEQALLEKPSGMPPKGSRKIAGRYVLSPDVFQHLTSIPELTTAINACVIRYAYVLEKDLLAFSPYQRILEVLHDEVFAFDHYT